MLYIYLIHFFLLSSIPLDEYITAYISLVLLLHISLTALSVVEGLNEKALGVIATAWDVVS